jgi:hypothetical protein
MFFFIWKSDALPPGKIPHPQRLTTYYKTHDERPHPLRGQAHASRGFRGAKIICMEMELAGMLAVATQATTIKSSLPRPAGRVNAAE